MCGMIYTKVKLIAERQKNKRKSWNFNPGNSVPRVLALICYTTHSSICVEFIKYIEHTWYEDMGGAINLVICFRGMK